MDQAHATVSPAGSQSHQSRRSSSVSTTEQSTNLQRSTNSSNTDGTTPNTVPVERGTSRRSASELSPNLTSSNERIFPIRSILNVRKDTQSTPPGVQRSPVNIKSSNVSSAGSSPVYGRDHVQHHKNFTLADSMSSIDEDRSTSNPRKPSSNQSSSKSSSGPPGRISAGSHRRQSRAISLGDMASPTKDHDSSRDPIVVRDKHGPLISSHARHPSPVATRSGQPPPSPTTNRNRPSAGMLINVSGLRDLPQGSTGPRSLSPDALDMMASESGSNSDKQGDHISPSRPKFVIPDPPARSETCLPGETPDGNTIGPSAAEPVPKQDVQTGYLTTRFEHAQTDDGFIVLTGRRGQITKCEDEPIRVPGAIQAFGVLIAVILHGDFDLPVTNDNHEINTEPLDPLMDAPLPSLESSESEGDKETHEALQISRVEVVQVSENSRYILGHSPQALLQLDSLTEILSPEEVNVLYDNLEVTLEPGQEQAGPHTFRLSGQGGFGSGLEGRSSKSSWTCWCAAHRPDPIRRPRLIIIEFEVEDDQVNPPSTITSEPLGYDERGGMEGEPYKPTDEDLIESTRSAIKPIKALSRLRKKGKDFSGDSVEVLSILSQVHEQFDKAKDMPNFLKMVVSVVRELTGFHRVMVYQFDESWNGQVVAELVDWKRTRDLYRGLRFPSTDIPAQARELYKINKVRMLYDRDMPTARLVCRSAEEVRTPLDMTHCHLRAMSPIHIKYLANMGVRASFSISIISNNALWGLISCHSYGRFGQRVTFPTRQFCRMLGDSVSRNIERLYLSQRLESRKLINTSATAANPSGYIVAKAEDLLWLFDAEFGVLSIGEEAKILGPVANSQELLAVLEYLRVKAFDTTQVSTDISQSFPDIAYPSTFKSICGMLVIPLSRAGQDFIAFFRQGQMKQIHWAGNPYEKNGGNGGSPTSSDHSAAALRTLEPRKSFKIWSETVRGRSKVWTEEQMETGLVLSLVYGKFIDVWRQKEAAVHNNQLQSLLLSNASHEVRTPLHQILSTLELALDGQLDDETRDNLSRSYHASKALLHVINDLLDLTKAEQGGDLFSRDPLHLASTIEEAVSIHRREAERKGLRFDVVEDPNGAPVTVTGDRARLRQVISNLVGNAVKHTSSGSVEVRWGEEPMNDIENDMNGDDLTTGSDSPSCRIFVSVIDTGRGIGEAKLESIFRAFEQVETDESAEGTGTEESIGLGLAVVGRVVHNLGGQLRVDSKVDQGSKFTIILPFTVLPPAAGSSLRSGHSSTGVSDNSGAMLRNLSDESGGGQQSRRILLAKRKSQGSFGSGSGGHQFEIDGLVEAMQGSQSVTSSTSPDRRGPMSSGRARLRAPAHAKHTPASARSSAEDVQTGSSASSHSAFGWPDTTRFEWPSKSKTEAHSNSSKAPSITPTNRPVSDHSDPINQAVEFLSNIDSKVHSRPRCSSDYVAAAKAGLSASERYSKYRKASPKKDNHSLGLPSPPSPLKLQLPLKKNSFRLVPTNYDESCAVLPDQTRSAELPQGVWSKAPETFEPSPKLVRSSSESKPKVKEAPQPSSQFLETVPPNCSLESPHSTAKSVDTNHTEGSKGSSQMQVDHISHFTRSPHARVISKQPMRVMVVEDDPINRVILKKKLTQSGHSVALTVHGLEAVELFARDEEFDVILMDLQMPICDGLEATRKIREYERTRSRQPEALPPSHRINRGVPILAVSASLQEQQRTEITDAGMDGWILKPVDFARLSNLMIGAVDLKMRAEQVYQPGLWEKGGYLGLPKRRHKS